MKIDINSVREKLTISAEPDDRASVASIQRRLKQTGLPFRTLDGSKGTWETGSEQILAIRDATADLRPTWSKECSERMRKVERDTESIARSNGGLNAAANSPLEHCDGLGYQLFPEQAVAAEYMASPEVDQFALFWGMGTGKTGAMIAAANELIEAGVIGGVLVVAERPVAMVDPWQASLENWLPSGQKQACPIGLVTPGIRKRLQTYYSEPTWLIVHYGLLTPDLEYLKSWADSRPGIERPLVIFDESDYIKNPKSHRSMSAKALREHFGRCWIASGTPAPNSPVDYQHQLSVSRGYPVNLGLSGEHEHDAGIVAKALKRDFYYLQQENPRKKPETVDDVLVDLNHTQRNAYDQIAGNLISDLENMDDGTFYRRRFDIMKRRTALLRVCSNPQHESLEQYGVPGVPDFNEPAKFEVIDSLLKNILAEEGEKVVIWTRFRDVAIRLQQRFATRWGARLFIGGEGDHKDLSTENCRVLVATLQKGSSSISLTEARNAIYESLDDVARDFEQSMARINRSGQEKDCRYWVLYSKDTIEEDVLANTRRKLTTSHAVLSDIGMPGRSELIEQLRRSSNKGRL